MKRMILMLLALTMAATACGGGDDAPLTAPFADVRNATVVSRAADGAVVYGDNGTGEVWRISSAGIRDTSPLARLSISSSDGTGFRGLVVNENNNVFASYIGADLRFRVARIERGQSEDIWAGPSLPAGNLNQARIGGQLTVTREGRILTGLGDFNNPNQAAEEDSPTGKLITLSPSQRETQRPNIIASGFSNPSALTYDQGGSLWVADGYGSNPIKVFRVSNSGQRGPETETGHTGVATGFTRFSEQELALCFSDNTQLQRFLIQDSTRAVPGRVLASDCTGGLTQTTDSRLVYSNTTGLGVTL